MKLISNAQLALFSNLAFPVICRFNQPYRSNEVNCRKLQIFSSFKCIFVGTFLEEKSYWCVRTGIMCKGFQIFHSVLSTLSLITASLVPNSITSNKKSFICLRSFNRGSILNALNNLWAGGRGARDEKRSR